MGTVIDAINCKQCGRRAKLEVRSGSTDIDCFDCGYTFSEKFVGTDKEDHDYLPAYMIHDLLIEGYLMLQLHGTACEDGALSMFLIKEIAGFGTAHHLRSMYTFVEPLSSELEMQYMADDTITYLTKWDYQANCLVVLKGEFELPNDL